MQSPNISHSYGEIGYTIIGGILRAEFPRDDPRYVNSPASQYPWETILTDMLMPELAIRLIQSEQHAQGYSEEMARQTLIDSVKYGRRRFPVNGDALVDDEVDKAARKTFHSADAAAKRQEAINSDWIF